MVSLLALLPLLVSLKEDCVAVISVLLTQTPQSMFQSAVKKERSDFKKPIYFPPISVLGQIIPFRILVKTDMTELTAVTAADMADMNEQNGMPAGIVGFSLNYAQQSC